MPHFEVFHDGKRLHTVEFTGVPLEIGRDGSAGLRLEDPLISRSHAKIYSSDGQVIVEDLGTSNGTFVNGVREYRRPLKNGDRLELGRYVVLYRQAEGEPVPEPVTPEGLADADDDFGGGATELIGPGLYNRLRQEEASKLEPHLRLQLESGSKTYPLKYSRLTIGTRDDCQIRVEAVERSEAALIEKQADGSFHIRKLGLLGAMLINGKKVKESLLADGDRIGLGSATFVFHAGAK